MAPVHDNEKPGTSKACMLPMALAATTLSSSSSATVTIPATTDPGLDLIDINDDDQLNGLVIANLDTYLNANYRNHTNFLTRGHSKKLREHEAKEREDLRYFRMKIEQSKAELRSLFESNLLTLSAKYLETRKLRKLIQETDNPPTFDDLLDRMVEYGSDEEYEDDYMVDVSRVEEEDSWESVRTVDTQAADPRSQGHESVLEDSTQEGSESVLENSTLEDPESVPGESKSDGNTNENGEESEREMEVEEFQEIPATPEGDYTRSSDEIFQTPVSHMVGDETVKSRVGAFKFPQWPGAEPVEPAMNPPVPIFQFQGNPTKEPRMIKPGEVLFSATGSPIAVAPPDQVPAALSAGGTTPLPTGVGSRKPIRLRVDDPNGGTMQVGLTCIQGEEEQFRKFMTDVRCFVTTRSMAQNKVLPPRVPTSGAKGRRRSNASASARKPIWRI